MQKKLIILIITFFIFNCESKVDSVGDFNEIIIVTSMDDRDLIFPYLNPIFSKQINTPTEENIFMVKWVDANNFFKYKYYKNIVFISLKKPIDKTADLLIEKFRKAGNNEKIYASYDIFAKDQLFLTIDAYDSIDLSDIMNLFGYVSLDATLQYAHINRPNFFDVYHEFHPRGQKNSDNRYNSFYLF